MIIEFKEPLLKIKGLITDASTILFFIQESRRTIEENAVLLGLIGDEEQVMSLQSNILKTVRDHLGDAITGINTLNGFHEEGEM